jgi:hypothetical protein
MPAAFFVFGVRLALKAQIAIPERKREIMCERQILCSLSKYKRQGVPQDPKKSVHRRTQKNRATDSACRAPPYRKI